MAKYIDAEEITPIMAEYVADVFSRKEHLDNISYGYCMEIADVFRRYAERAKQEQPEVDSEKPVPNDLEEAAWGYASKECEKEDFIAGAKWQKEQMIKEAIHYVVQDDLDSQGASYNIPFIRIGTNALKPKGIGIGDKVCIIIVKE